jgi:hypothetical protein
LVHLPIHPAEVWSGWSSFEDSDVIASTIGRRGASDLLSVLGIDLLGLRFDARRRCGGGNTGLTHGSCFFELRAKASVFILLASEFRLECGGANVLCHRAAVESQYLTVFTT